MIFAKRVSEVCGAFRCVYHTHARSRGGHSTPSPRQSPTDEVAILEQVNKFLIESGEVADHAELQDVHTECSRLHEK